MYHVSCTSVFLPSTLYVYTFYVHLPPPSIIVFFYIPGCDLGAAQTFDAHDGDAHDGDTHDGDAYGGNAHDGNAHDGDAQ